MEIPIFSMNYLERFKTFSKGLPVLFFYSHKDVVVPAEEVLKFYNCSKGEREIIEISERHEEDRGRKVLEQGIGWVKKERSRRSGKIKLSCWS